MKGNDIAMWITIAVLAYIGWILVDMSAPTQGGIGGSSGGSLASISSSSVPVLVEFYADWCGPCKMIEPEVISLAEELSGKAKIIRINIDEHPSDASAHRIHGVPTFIAFQTGRETSRQEGGIPKARMKAMLGL